MSAQIIDGKAFAATVRQKVAAKVSDLKAAHGITPGLAVVLVGTDPASFTPPQYLLVFEDQLARGGRDLEAGTDRSVFEPVQSLDEDGAEWEIGYTLAFNVAVLVLQVDELAGGVVAPEGVHLAVMPSRREVLAAGAVEVEANSDR